MKKTIIVLLIFCLGCNLTWAQNSRHEVSLGYGLLTTSELVSAFSDIIMSGMTDGMYKTANDAFSGSFQLGYKYALSDRFWMGASFMYEKATSDVVLAEQNEGKFSNDFFTLAAEFRYHYIDHTHFALYGLLGAGATSHNQNYTKPDGAKSKENITHFNFQFSPIGFRYGKTVGAYGELGFGYKGLANVGMYVKF